MSRYAWFCLIFGAALALAAPIWATDTMPSTGGIEAKPAVEPSQTQPSQTQPSKTAGYQCPKTEYVNCMPPISAETRPFCNKDYIAWATSHCPDFKVVY